MGAAFAAACLLALASAATSQEAPEVIEASQPSRPLLGVIRWDMYSGHPYTTQKQEFGFLKPEKYHWRAPFFVRRTGDPEAPLAFNPEYLPEPIQEATDAEIAFAASGGIDYWAFGHHGRHQTVRRALRDGLEAYLRSPLKTQVGFCLIANAAGMGSTEFWEPASVIHTEAEVLDDWRQYVDEYVELMREPTYQRVLGGRPLLYVYQPSLLGEGQRKEPAPLALIRGAFDHLRNRLQQSGVGNPYIVGMVNSGLDVWRELVAEGLLDAVTLYHYRYGVPEATEPIPYADLWPAIRRTVLDGVFGDADLRVVPILMSGADWMPRAEKNPEIFPAWDWAEPLPGDLARHVTAGLDYVVEHPAKCEANSVIMYGWNEHSEGGAICPLMGEAPDYRPVTRQIDEVSGALRSWVPPSPPTEAP